MKIIYLILLSILLSSFSYAGEKGKASHYHKKFEGKRTASGAIYRASDFVCAHKKYPFGTELYVRNTANGKRVKVKVVDRGPYTKGRVVDLSHAAAEHLGLMGAGIISVEVFPVIDSLENLPLSTLLKIEPLDIRK